MENTKIGSISAIFLVITIMINHICLSFPKNILDSTGSATPLNIIYISILAVILVLLICTLFKRFPGQDILDISNFLFGKYFKFLIGILFLIFLLTNAGYLLSDFCEGLRIIYFARTNILYILAIFIITIIIVTKLGDKAITRANLLILPLALFSIIFIFVANAKNFVPQRIFPILGYGFDNTFIKGCGNLYAFGNISFLYFLPSYLKDVKQLKKVSIISIVISAIYLLLCLSSLLFMFPFTLSNQEIMPLYLASRYVEFGTFFQRVDSIFLLVWIWTMISHLSIIMMLSIKIAQKITFIKNRNILIYFFALIILIVSIIPQNLIQINFFENTIYKDMVLYFILLACILILLFANIKYRLTHKKDKNEEEILLES